jgi:phosphotransferase system enzyme I (PtsI)
MAGDPSFALVLLGLGLDELSMNSSAIPLVKSVIRSITAKAARELALGVLDLPTPDEIEEAVAEVMAKHFSAEMVTGKSG